jgi:hypothetical protein
MDATAAAASTQPAVPPPHPSVAPLSFLLGKWSGEGEGTFPTIAPFRYGEEILFSHHPSKVPVAPHALAKIISLVGR